MLTELWELKDEVHLILINEYEDNCRFSLTENQYKGIYSEFSWWNSTLDINPTKLENQHYAKEAPFVTYLVEGTCASCTGWGAEVETSRVNLLKATYLLTQNEEINKLYIESLNDYRRINIS